MDATIENNGEIGLEKEVDDYGRISVGTEYTGETIQVAFEVVDDDV